MTNHHLEIRSLRQDDLSGVRGAGLSPGVCADACVGCERDAVDESEVREFGGGVGRSSWSLGSGRGGFGVDRVVLRGGGFGGGVGVAKEDWGTVAKISHTLQAALRLFGSEVLDLAIALEDSCKRGPMVENRVRFEKFSGELENVPIEVQGYLQGT